MTITFLPVDSEERKGLPVATGVVDYFPLALVAIAGLSRIGNDKHNPGEPLHWARGKGGNNSDELMRHFIERGTIDDDGVRHSTKVAWRALALLQLELEGAKTAAPPPVHAPEKRDPKAILAARETVRLSAWTDTRGGSYAARMYADNGKRVCAYDYVPSLGACTCGCGGEVSPASSRPDCCWNAKL